MSEECERKGKGKRGKSFTAQEACALEQEIDLGREFLQLEERFLAFIEQKKKIESRFGRGEILCLVRLALERFNAENSEYEVRGLDNVLAVWSADARLPFALVKTVTVCIREAPAVKCALGNAAGENDGCPKPVFGYKDKIKLERELRARLAGVLKLEEKQVEIEFSGHLHI